VIACSHSRRKSDCAMRASIGALTAVWLIGLFATTACAGDVPRVVRITTDGALKQRPVWSPDGKQVLFSRHRAGRIGLVLFTVESREEKELTSGKLPQYDASWHPEGKRIVFTNVPQFGTQGDLDVHTAVLEAGELKESNPLAGNQGKLSHEEFPTWSPDGKRIVFTSTFEGNQEIYTINAEGMERARLTNDPAIDAHPAWSPDGTRVAFATNRWGDFEIALMNADGSNLTRLTTSRGLDDYPVFSPDGRSIAFTSNRDGNYEIYVISPEGTNVLNVSRNEALENFPAWTPDGRLSFMSNRDGAFDLYVVRAD
jgi:TolB protein